MTLDNNSFLLKDILQVNCWPVSLDVNVDRSLLIASSKGHIVELKPDKTDLKIINEPAEEIYDFCIDHHNMILIIASADFTIRKWDLKKNCSSLSKKVTTLITA